QWRKDGVDIPGATSLTLNYSPVKLADNNGQFSVVVSNPQGNATSAAATLTVTPDVTKPTIARVFNSAPTNLQVTFSEVVEVASATTVANYALSGGITITAAVIGSDPRIVLLTTSAMSYGSTYVLTVNQVRDAAVTPNTIIPNSQFSFIASPYSPIEI